MERFETYRPLLFSIAYRMLGSAMEAEDILQDAYIRYQAMPPQSVRQPKHLLTTIVTRLCLNQLDRAHVRRESYVGPWLPEPLATDEKSMESSPERRTVEMESISMAFLILLETLSPAERAVFLLREVFEFTYAEISEVVEKSEGACRQIFHRAHKHISENRPRFESSPEAHEAIFERFLHATQAGDLDALMQLMNDEVTLWADGGGRIPGAATRPIQGPQHVARFVIGSTRFAPGELAVTIREINHKPAILLLVDEKPFVVVDLDIQDEHIHAIRLFGNPDKLRGV